MLILGIDPGLRYTGFGLIELKKDNTSNYIASGVICTDSSDELHKRLNTIFSGVCTIMDKYNPNDVCIEKIFFSVNPKTTLLLGQARGVAICAATMKNDKIYEYTALQIKQSVVGYGHASKQQIQEMVKQRLALTNSPRADAADALACAITHTQYYSSILNQYL
jgi:crossover junction endodeoxyribonuclease RuvC